ncbi:MAG: HDOD domain-containing protein [Planctomycetota bacterium]
MSQTPLAKLAYHKRIRREILVKGDLIPPLPDIVVRVLDLLNAGDTEPEQLEEHLQHDPVLVARMLGMVNSPFYGISRQISSVREAVMVLGFRGLRSLILASGTTKFLKRDYRCYGHDENGLWKHSLAVASGAKALAATLGKDAEMREGLFVAGLLHDIGKMLLAPYLREQEFERSTDAELVELEQTALGVDHAEAGELVARKWNLSDTVQAVLAEHHRPPENDLLREHVAIVRLADALAHNLGAGFESTQKAEISQSDLEIVELTTDRWAELRADLEDSVGAALAQLEALAS